MEKIVNSSLGALSKIFIGKSCLLTMVRSVAFAIISFALYRYSEKLSGILRTFYKGANPLPRNAVTEEKYVPLV